MRTGSAFVGRERERATLRESVAVGPALTVVVGPVGVGKTALVETAVLSSPDRRVVRGRADQFDRAEFGLWRGVLRQLGRPWPGLSPPGSAGSPGSAEEQRWEVLDAVAAALLGASVDVVFLDDAHWADDSSSWVLEHLLDHLHDPAVGATTAFVVASRRSVETSGSRWASLCRRATRITLDGLSVAEVGALLGLLGDTSDPLGLHARTGGNPLLIGEVLQHGATGSGASDLLRSTLTEAGDDVAELVAALCVAGLDTPLGWLTGPLGRDLASLEADLAVATRSGLVRVVDASLRPRNGLLAEVARDWFGPERSRELHRSLARAWRRQRSAGPALRAARHALAGLADPTSPPDPTALGEALALVGEAIVLARGDGQLAAAAEVLGEARAAAHVGGAQPAVVARLAVDEATVRWELDDVDAALAAGTTAASAADASGDPTLIAAAELLALRQHNPFAPDPLRVARLSMIEANLPGDADLALRARLRGRRAVLSFSLPHEAREAVALADEAVAMARRSGRPDALVDALRDRYFVLTSPADLDGRADAAAEIVELARHHGHPPLSLLGLEWLFASALGRGDTAAATDALDRLDALAAVMSSPSWRYAALVRRAGLAALRGDPDGALMLAETARTVGHGAVPEPELLGLDLAIRFGVADLYRREPIGLAGPLAAMTAALDHVPLLFAQAMLATYELQIGEHTAARRRLVPWVARFADALNGPEGVGILALAARVASSLQWQEPAPELISLLEPFTGRLDNPGGIGITRPVDLTLAELHLVLGDSPAALRYAHRAVDLARHRGLGALLPDCLDTLATASGRAGDVTASILARDAAEAAAEPLGIALPPAATSEQPGAGTRDATGPSPEERTAHLALTEDVWMVTTHHGPVRLPDSTGARQLIRLLVAPGTPVSAVELAGGAGGNDAARARDLGPALDQRAKQEYRRRITELRLDIDEAEAAHDIERAARHRIELDALLDQLRAAVGLAGRDRPQQSGAEKARINVTRNIRRAIATIAAAQPTLGAHLQNSIHTGHSCSYSPEPAAAISWHAEPA